MVERGGPSAEGRVRVGAIEPIEQFKNFDLMRLRDQQWQRPVFAARASKAVG